ncbi:histidine kinase, partial [Pelomicrobium sp. G1]|uniref:histidine kinase n=1 Tax=Pelomicrobium sp. G1 TaxID=3452920 RepID=UPI003F75B656
VREEERRRVAREIHDELGAMLTALKLDVTHCVQRLAPHLADEDRETIGKTIRAIDASIDAVRRIVTDLARASSTTSGPGPRSSGLPRACWSRPASAASSRSSRRR